MCVGYFLFTGFDVVANFEFCALCTKICVLKAVLSSSRKWHAHYFEPLCASICSALLQECEEGGRILFGDTSNGRLKCSTLSMVNNMRF